MSYVLMCLTGSNRQMLRDEDNLQKLDQLLRSVNLILRKCPEHSPCSFGDSLHRRHASQPHELGQAHLASCLRMLILAAKVCMYVFVCR